MTPIALAMLLLMSPSSVTQPEPESAAPVEIVVFSDFQCPFCAQFSRAFRELQTRGVEGVETKFVFKNFPLGIHSLARLAHRAALAAGEQGKFWEMHDLLFANQRRAQRDDLLAYATDLGLDMSRFADDLDSDRIGEMIDGDVVDGEKQRVDGTPTFYVNGKPYVGTQSIDQLKAIVQSAHRQASAVAAIPDALLSKGLVTAPITVEFFADLQSPVSGPALVLLDEVLARYASTVRVQFRNFPLAFHPQAALAHEAAVAAALQGRFWEFAVFALDHQDGLREQDVIALATRLGLGTAEFEAAIRDHRYASRVDADVRAALAKGVRGSPAILVDGRRLDGVPSIDALVDHVEAALPSRHVNARH